MVYKFGVFNVSKRENYMSRSEVISILGKNLYILIVAIDMVLTV